MALVETLRHLRIVMNDDGSIRSVTGEFDEIDTVAGRTVPKGTKRITAADLAGALPDATVMLAAVDAAQAERDAIKAERDQLAEQLAAAQAAPAPEPGSAEAYGAAVQAHLDDVAKAHGYNDALTCVSYHGSANPAWAADAQCFMAWRDAVWLYAYTQLAAVQSNQREQPTVAELIAALPAITWPT